MTEEDPDPQTTLWEPTRDHVVVCVDDEQPVLESLRRLLRHEPYDFRTTPVPGEALQWVEDTRVSVFITDQRMPEVSGTELADQVRERSPETERVILTGYPDLDVIHRREARQIRRLITKPWSDDDLKKTIRLLLRECELKESAAPRVVTPGPASRPTLEREPGGDRIMVRLDCRGRNSDDMIATLASILRQPDALLDGVLIHLTHLGDLQDSYSEFLTTLATQVLTSGVRASVREPSGMAQLCFKQLFGPSLPAGLEVLPSPPMEEEVDDEDCCG